MRGSRALWIGIALCCAATSASASAPRALPGAQPFDAALRARLEQTLAARAKGSVPRTRHRGPDGAPLYTNRLLLERSPYLRQHAHNPVDWFPWGEEAFVRARELSRPVLVSIGYSTCHWCHVMEEESFDDLETAELLNRHFVAIKVDREARPEIDAIYMSAIQAMGQGGGWPLNVFVTPEGHPFFGGTYFPPEGRAGRPGFRSVLEQIRDVYADGAAELAVRARALGHTLAQQLGAPGAAVFELRATPLERAAADYASRYDEKWGGLEGRIKFPSSLPVRALLRWYRRSGNPRVLEMATHTLDRMASGGLRDHLGGGFHRYSTDRRWLVPHFEKMLYDQALLAVAYLEGWQVSGRADFAALTREILDYVLREMTAPQDAFYSATDADSPSPSGEMQEGAYFTWTPAEIDAALPPPQARLARAFWGVSETGDLEGRSVLRAWKTLDATARELERSAAAVRGDLESARATLLEARRLRAPPLRDEKVIAAWNGLMISALARAGFAFAESRYVDAAARAARFVLGRMRTGARLHRIWLEGVAEGPAFLDDYAFMVAALLDLYEADPDPRWLEEALALQRTLDRHYADPDFGGYYRTADDAEKLIAREKPLQDGAVPSGNSIATLNLLRLATFTTDAHWAERARLSFAPYHAILEQSPTAASELLLALDYAVDPKQEILLVHVESVDPEPLLAKLRPAFVPNRILAVVAEGDELARHAAHVPLLRHKKARRAGVTAYVCEDSVCKRPTSDPEVFERLIRGASPGAPAPAGDPR